ncbi:hypothetical protein BDA96_05G056500 [Sorghum bicolor]|uniref:Uncharacterized protein n=2 Tax=Sorghum bicolor TaxID=4558 RepID=C5Y5N7_SORBI|nr:putative disease resistance RPP13-like protein 1 [Sorghum bicolor]XP_021316303.1 putative disease resistance RPP13-like protein 1 [Sorghum bicolor]XP_021316304.1 putative disease resistance RPP13-like protein 1 [Sorghum bicolor]EES08064.2 hypothetical protein SORBI_3005G054600 [Sorghum bicolor]KAG0528955.1 hypothetical protein BDA96_05G056500 [Sorghum bicolor]|eukprot:XP_021316302.1 putative disease resistance RPP13-like protein 1 [Sorghum bicolor]
MAVVLDALASYLQDMLVEMVEEEVHLLLGVPDEIEKMGIKLGDLKRFLADADKRNIRDETVQSWVRELRNAMYDATNILDLCQINAMERGPTKDKGCFNPLLFCIRNPLHAHDIGNRIKSLNKRLDDIEKRSKAFNFNLASYEDNTRMVESSLRTRRETTGEDEFGVVGEKIEEDTRSLVDLLIKKEKNVHEHKNVMVYAIVGVGGIGKTTLAKKIFNHDIIKQEYEKRIWLSVNKEFNDIDLLERAITEAQGDLQAARNTKAALERTLKEALKGCKTLLVMDDVWDPHVWEKVLEPPLINSLARGSRVLVTTRHDMVARGMMAEVPYHHVKKLEHEDAWSLLKKQVIGNGNNDEKNVDRLKEIGMEIIAKCDGLPLAVKVMGGLLRQKNTRQRDWEKILNDSIWSVSQMPEELNYAVYISYQDLNPNLKSCFLHYALLTQNTVFYDDNIVAMWISEGFVHGNSTCDLEALGKDYYGELIARNLIEPDQLYLDQAVCNMHDVVRSFAQYVSRDEALVAQKIEVGLTNKLNSQNVTRLSLECKESESNELEWSSLQANRSLRTLILVGKMKINRGDSLLSFPCLRTLHIEDGNFDALSKSLVQLKHLRYLSIRGSDTSRLPKRIAMMKFLQCINISYCKSLVKLPRDIGELRQLRYLSLVDSGINSIPKSFGGLTNLRLLFGFPAHVEGDWCSLEELGPLNKLMRLDIDGLENVSSSAFAIKARLREKVRLSYLVLKGTSTRRGPHRLVKEVEQQQIQKVFDELCPPPCLETLLIEGYFSQQLPKWMMPTKISSLGNLRNLEMEDLPYCTDLPDGLWQLPSLEFLKIESAPGIKRVGPEFVLPHHHEHPSPMENVGSDLEIEVDECSGLERISNLPNLQSLVIFRCPGLKVLEGLPALQRLGLEDYDMKTLPGYVRNVNPRDLDLYCDILLLASIAKGKSSPEWDKFSHIKHVKAYAHDNDNNIGRKWYVKYTRDPFSFKTNISLSADASGDETEEALLDEVEQISRNEIEEEHVNVEQLRE